MEKDDLILDCPRCRSRALPYYSSDHGYFVCCTNSDYITKLANTTPQEAIAAWNEEIIAMRNRRE